MEKILISLAEELKKLANFGGLLFTYLLGPQAENEKVGYLLFVAGWWVCMQVIAHAILYVAADDNESG